MPVIQIYAPRPHPPTGLLAELCAAVAQVAGITSAHVWAMWHGVEPQDVARPEWAAGSVAPVVFVRCKSRYSRAQVAEFLRTIQRVLSIGLGCPPDEVYVAAQRVHPHELLVRGTIWQGEDVSGQAIGDITLRPVGVVRSPRRDLRDDLWGGVISTIELDAQRFSHRAVAGLDEFSHLEVVFFMHLVPEHEIEIGARRPRGRRDWPEVGIFAQRAKGRPNRLGVSRCRLLRVDGLRLTVEGLDAVDGTPVLDVKPYMDEFGPRGPVRQPWWSRELMARYYDEASTEAKELIDEDTVPGQ
jgi:tRNA-Thr(GGU) m(6)t(6)A37 methyltransferase TsaA